MAPRLTAAPRVHAGSLARRLRHGARIPQLRCLRARTTAAVPGHAVRLEGLGRGVRGPPRTTSPWRAAAPVSGPGRREGWYSILVLTKSPHRRVAELRERRPRQRNVRDHRYRSRMDGCDRVKRSELRPASARTTLPTTTTTSRPLPSWPLYRRCERNTGQRNVGESHSRWRILNMLSYR